MIERLGGTANPNLFLLNYNPTSLLVTNLVIVPKQFFTLETIEERPPLPPTARRAGWIGCRILLEGIPAAGRIVMIRNGEIAPKAEVLSSWRRTLFLRQQPNLGEKTWLVHVMKCIERISKDHFTLEKVYAYEAELGAAYPGNRHIRPKIRQKLQVLRDNGFIEFLGHGNYRVVDVGN